MGGSALVVIACIGVPGVVFYVQLRHWIFVALALVPPIAVFASAALLRQRGLDQALTAALFGMISALRLADETVRGISGGLTRGAAVSNAGRFVMRSIGPILTTYLLSLCASAAVLYGWQITAAVAVLFTTGFASAVLGNWLCAFSPLSEPFITRANAARERRERTFEQFFPEIQPRWAFSVTGIAVVLGAVAVFGIRDAHVYWTTRAWLCLPVGLAFVAVGFSVVAREWRMMVALSLAAAFNGALLCWAFARRDHFIDPLTFGAVLALSSVPLSVVAARARSYLLQGDDLAPALAVAIRDEGAIAVGLGVIAGSAGLLATATSAMLSPALVFAIAATFAGLLLFPALTIAIHTLLPRYRTVDEVFGRR